MVRGLRRRRPASRSTPTRPTSGKLPAAIVVTLLALLVFGYIKGLFTTGKPVRSAAQTVIVGGLAASAAFMIAKALG